MAALPDTIALFMEQGVEPYRSDSQWVDNECMKCGTHFWGATDSIKISRCGHRFHRVCLRGWLQVDNKDSCPACGIKLWDASTLHAVDLMNLIRSSNSHFGISDNTVNLFLIPDGDGDLFSHDSLYGHDFGVFNNGGAGSKGLYTGYDGAVGQYGAGTGGVPLEQEWDKDTNEDGKEEEDKGGSGKDVVRGLSRFKRRNFDLYDNLGGRDGVDSAYPFADIPEDADVSDWPYAPISWDRVYWAAAGCPDQMWQGDETPLACFESPITGNVTAIYSDLGWVPPHQRGL
ncbi:hypothetical protein BDV96DRAFT_582908 [Lophiotrema nucula]|uniref:RING-type domain-containing protein n=1 Tax=Lophiotrema nucula TaxID=690887 RepID=A0A6A5YVK4_9PLEO|nr:hypothetical protein BDV96DRAFT_582908 [Lophiotrema nucula]